MVDATSVKKALPTYMAGTSTDYTDNDVLIIPHAIVASGRPLTVDELESMKWEIKQRRIKFIMGALFDYMRSGLLVMVIIILDFLAG